MRSPDPARGSTGAGSVDPLAAAREMRAHAKASALIARSPPTMATALAWPASSDDSHLANDHYGGSLRHAVSRALLRPRLAAGRERPPAR
jgi:hypothetical protein